MQAKWGAHSDGGQQRVRKHWRHGCCIGRAQELIHKQSSRGSLDVIQTATPDTLDGGDGLPAIGGAQDGARSDVVGGDEAAFGVDIVGVRHGSGDVAQRYAEKPSLKVRVSVRPCDSWGEGATVCYAVGEGEMLYSLRDAAGGDDGGAGWKALFALLTIELILGDPGVQALIFDNEVGDVGSKGVGFVAEGDGQGGVEAAEGAGEGDGEVDGGGGEGEGGAGVKGEAAAAEGAAGLEQDEVAEGAVGAEEGGDGIERGGGGEAQLPRRADRNNFV